MFIIFLSRKLISKISTSVKCQKKKHNHNGGEGNKAMLLKNLYCQIWQKSKLPKISTKILFLIMTPFEKIVFNLFIEP